MTKGRTLWEMWCDWISGPTEMRYFNPLRAKVGASVTLDVLDYRDGLYTVSEIREYTRAIGQQTFKFVDYVLLARLTGDKPRYIRLRVLPGETALTNVAVNQCQALLLELDDEMGWDQGGEELHQVVTDTTGRFAIHQDDVLVAEYWRVNDVLAPYDAQVAVLSDVNEDGSVTNNEVRAERIQYWDYWRETLDEANQTLLEFVIVELDQESGWTRIWNGISIEPTRVSCV